MMFLHKSPTSIENPPRAQRHVSSPPTHPGDEPDPDRPITVAARDYAGAHRFEWHSHLRAQLVHALAGALRVTAGGRCWVVPTEQAVWVPPGVEHEVVTAVSFPLPVRAAYMKFPNPASRYAIVGVMVAQTSQGVRVAVTGAGPSVFRVPEMEGALGREFAPEALAGVSISSEDLNEDIHASAEYRAHLVTVMAKRAVAAAAG